MYLQALQRRVQKKGDFECPITQPSLRMCAVLFLKIALLSLVNNALLEKGWVFISACQVGTPEAMDIVYIVGASEEVYTATCQEESALSHFLGSKFPGI